MIDELIRQGRILRGQITRHYNSGYETLPPEERITVAEFQGWYSGVEAVLEQKYGSKSPELVLWRAGLEHIQKESWEEVGRKPRPDGYFTQRNLEESLGLLAQIRLLRLRESQDAPTMLFSTFHEKLISKCQPLFAVGAYDSAVFEAFRLVEEAVRTLSGFSNSDVGVNLISKALGSKVPPIQLSDVAAEQEGFHSLFRGAIGAFKNPGSHRTVGHTDATRVMELLAFASLLLKLLDDTKK